MGKKMNEFSAESFLVDIVGRQTTEAVEKIAEKHPEVMDYGEYIVEWARENGTLNELFTEKENLEEEMEIIEPYNPKDVNVQPKTMVLSNVIERLENGAIILDPDYQRNPKIPPSWSFHSSKRIQRELRCKRILYTRKS